MKEEAVGFQQLFNGRDDVRVLLTGMGRTNAMRAIRPQMAMLTVPRLVISCGFAGGLSPKLAAGTVVFDADKDFPLTYALQAAGAWPGTFHCAPKIAVTGGEKRLLRHATRADAVDMESEVIREACRERGIPSATVRIISDTLDEDLPLDFNALMTPDLKMDYVKLAFALMKSPGKISELMRFRKRVNTSSQGLAEVLFRVLAG
ncbi:MAG: hypothetical protein HY300_04560 [Verrucomicrobia bacterium]|nr:hypothetical protein [Verrucomicrobiota bacterium]